MNFEELRHLPHSFDILGPQQVKAVRPSRRKKTTIVHYSAESGASFSKEGIQPQEAVF